MIDIPEDVTFEEWTENDDANFETIPITLNDKDLEVKLNTRPIYTFGNEDNLVQVINILLDNAIKYSEPNKIIEITLKKKNFSQVIEIKDQGIGIAAKDMPYVFDRFYRTEQSRSKLVSDSGYGLGLPLAKYLVELHNGSINISSKNNNGTKVSINLPSMK